MSTRIVVPDTVDRAALVRALATLGLYLRPSRQHPGELYLAEIPGAVRSVEPVAPDIVRHLNIDLSSTPLSSDLPSGKGPRSRWEGLRYTLLDGRSIDLQVLSARPGLIRTRSSCPDSIVIEHVTS